MLAQPRIIAGAGDDVDLLAASAHPSHIHVERLAQLGLDHDDAVHSRDVGPADRRLLRPDVDSSRSAPALGSARGWRTEIREDLRPGSGHERLGRELSHLGAEGRRLPRNAGGAEVHQQEAPAAKALGGGDTDGPVTGQFVGAEAAHRLRVLEQASATEVTPHPA